MIFDEVVTGFRLALGGAQEYFGVEPDLASYGKIVGGGGPLGAVAGREDVIQGSNPKNKGQSNYAYVNGTLHGNPMAAAAGLATIRELEAPDFYSALHSRATSLLSRLQEVLDAFNVPAIAAGEASLWQFLFMSEPPANHADMLAGDQASMRKLDLELLKHGVYVLPGVRRFTSAVNTDEDFDQTVDALEHACRSLGYSS